MGPLTFVDTSALYALLSAQDPMHGRAARTFASLEDSALVTHNYVLVEAGTLVGRRLGVRAARELFDALLGPVEVHWVDVPTHRAAVASFLTGSGRRPSLVDHVSFEVMRRRGIHRAFAYDPDFARQGFELVS